MRFRIASDILYVGILAGAARPGETEAPPHGCAYEIAVRLEIPNVITWATDTTNTLCIPSGPAARNVPFTVLSDNNPLSACPAENVRRDGAHLSFDIVCKGATGRGPAPSTPSCTAPSGAESRW